MTLRYRHLTRSYVEWMRLPLVPVPIRPSVCFVPENAVKPEFNFNLGVGVIFEGHLYARSACGLSFDLERKL